MMQYQFYNSSLKKSKGSSSSISQIIFIALQLYFVDLKLIQRLIAPVDYDLVIDVHTKRSTLYLIEKKNYGTM